MAKKTILHFTYNLARGGAEIMLVRVVKELPEYRNIVVELYGENAFGEDLSCDEYISLNIKSYFKIPLAIFRLRRLIKLKRPDIIHTHLFWPTVIARIATPRRIPLITTMHTSVKRALDYKKWHVRLLDRFTSRLRRYTLIGVSENALNEYLHFLRRQPHKSFLLHTFADTEKFLPAKKVHRIGPIKFMMVSVGALRPGKNFEFLIRALQGNKNAELHIFGEGSERETIEQLIKEHDAPVKLKGEVDKIEDFLPEYDLYVSASCFEGFSLSILEAMSANIPLLLSNIPAFMEQCGDTAIYFELNDPVDFIEKVDHCINNHSDLQGRADLARQRVLEHYTLDKHTTGLKKIYLESLAESA